MDTSASPQSFEIRSQAELRGAPPQFIRAFYTLGNIEPKQSMEAFASVIPNLSEDYPMWAGTGMCCYAYCLKEMEEYQEAVARAENGKQLGLSLMGHWYYHDVVVQSLNMLDELPRALQAAEAAIQFFRDERSSGNTASYLVSKANVLKQMAAHLSSQEESKAVAKTCTVEAIKAICTSLSINSEGMEDVREELGALASIAARVDVRAPDLDFFRGLSPEILPFIEQQFGNMNLKDLTAMELFNQSVETRRRGDREHAAILLKRALNVATEQTDEDRAFKAFLAYQHGVNLLKANNLETYHAGRQLSPAEAKAADEIRFAWKECLRLYETVGQQHLSEFSKRFANLTDAVWNIKRDNLMGNFHS